METNGRPRAANIPVESLRRARMVAWSFTATKSVWLFGKPSLRGQVKTKNCFAEKSNALDASGLTNLTPVGRSLQVEGEPPAGVKPGASIRNKWWLG